MRDLASLHSFVVLGGALLGRADAGRGAGPVRRPSALLLFFTDGGLCRICRRATGAFAAGLFLDSARPRSARAFVVPPFFPNQYLQGESYGIASACRNAGGRSGVWSDGGSGDDSGGD